MRSSVDDSVCLMYDYNTWWYDNDNGDVRRIWTWNWDMIPVASIVLSSNQHHQTMTCSVLNRGSRISGTKYGNRCGGLLNPVFARRRCHHGSMDRMMTEECGYGYGRSCFCLLLTCLQLINGDHRKPSPATCSTHSIPWLIQHWNWSANILNTYPDAFQVMILMNAGIYIDRINEFSMHIHRCACIVLSIVGYKHPQVATSTNTSTTLVYPLLAHHSEGSVAQTSCKQRRAWGWDAQVTC